MTAVRQSRVHTLTLLNLSYDYDAMLFFGAAFFLPPVQLRIGVFSYALNKKRLG